MGQSPDTAKSVAALEMISFHSVSKGFIGECGIRGGYFELFNIADEVKAQLYKLASLTLCSNTHGQLSVGLMVRPPTDADASFATYTAEKQSIFNSLKRRATKLEAALNKLVGVSTQPLEGAMYAFPQIELPSGVIKAASAAKMQPDAFFAMKLLEGTGIVVVPGSGFGQVDGTWHIRTTFLPPEDEMDDVIELFSSFHESFM